MAGASYNKVSYSSIASPYTAQPNDAGFVANPGIGVHNVRGVTVLVSAADGEQLVGGTLEAWGLVPTEVGLNLSPTAATRRWVRVPKCDMQDLVAGRDAVGHFDLTGLGLIVDQLAWLPAALAFSGGTTLSLLYSVRKWGI